ncbi:hypothetical protein Amac_002710 [Acrocarpospora macrocephala]|uniref:Uncharacterized protein n=1 Tax=Acrocarpospora macrocephala TaxID=150177 RepID=A0A5M3WCW4_9ACTN|nr:hypothetical protein Amac_002710 [Acrocarpospora macrocephala]
MHGNGMLSAWLPPSHLEITLGSMMPTWTGKAAEPAPSGPVTPRTRVWWAQPLRSSQTGSWPATVKYIRDGLMHWVRETGEFGAKLRHRTVTVWPGSRSTTSGPSTLVPPVAAVQTSTVGSSAAAMALVGPGAGNVSRAAAIAIAPTAARVLRDARNTVLSTCKWQ